MTLSNDLDDDNIKEIFRHCSSMILNLKLPPSLPQVKMSLGALVKGLQDISNIQNSLTQSERGRLKAGKNHVTTKAVWIICECLHINGTIPTVKSAREVFRALSGQVFSVALDLQSVLDAVEKRLKSEFKISITFRVPDEKTVEFFFGENPEPKTMKRDAIRKSINAWKINRTKAAFVQILQTRLLFLKSQECYSLNNEC